jgi:nucleoside 2-deoxyribosyltransferase
MSKFKDKDGKHLYLSGGWFSPKQLELHKKFYGDEEYVGNPRLMKIEGKSPHDVFEMDIECLKGSYEMHAMICENDTGTIWEMGLAWALGIPVYLLVENIEEVKKNKVNIMLSESITGVVTLDMYEDFLQGNNRERAQQLKAELFQTWDDVF